MAKSDKELDRIRKLLEEGLNEAAKDPEKYMYLQREKDKLVKPWEKALKDWEPMIKKDKKKKASEEDLEALRTFQAAVQEKK